MGRKNLYLKNNLLLENIKLYVFFLLLENNREG